MTHFHSKIIFLSRRACWARCFITLQSAEAAPLVAVLTSDGWETQWPLPEASLAPLVTAFQTQCEETHAQAWQRLFVGPWALPSPPWGSVWLDRESVLFGDSTLALRQWMREKGIQFEMKQNEPEDHFGSLLLMAAWLAENGRQTECEELLAWHLFPGQHVFLTFLSKKQNTLSTVHWVNWLA